MFKSYLSKGLTQIKSKSPDLKLLRLDKTFFHLDNDIYLCNCYIPPQNSNILKQYNEIPFDILRTELHMFGSKGDLIILGDFNSRTGNIQESFHSAYDMTNTNYSTPDINTETNIPVRVDEDATVNQFGKQVIENIEEAHMTILNGRILGHFQGNKTCHNKAIRDGKYLALLHASAWQRSPH